MTDDLEFKIARLELRHGDILVLKVSQILSETQHVRMQAVVKRIDPNLRALILEKGMDLAVLTRAEIEARTS